MTMIRINGPKPYEILIEPGALETVTLQTNQTLVVSDANVHRWYDVNADAPHHIIEPGEPSKNFDNYKEILEKLAAIGAKRDATIIALGGGVVGDLAGFAAATWMRGIDYIQVPTTLLAMVDSSVGGKTAIDLNEAKNLVGAFHPPRFVLIDPQVLDSLPSREFNAGMAEVIKYGMIFDESFLTWIEENTDFIGARDAETMVELIAKCVQFKADVVERDLYETGDRALLNFGHTFAHAIEAEQEYGELNHGEAVAIGMVLATKLSNIDTTRLEALLKKFNLPTSTDIDADKLIARMQLDKKATQKGLRFITLKRYGEAQFDANVDENRLKTVLAP